MEPMFLGQNSEAETGKEAGGIPTLTQEALLCRKRERYKILAGSIKKKRKEE